MVLEKYTCKKLHQHLKLLTSAVHVIYYKLGRNVILQFLGDYSKSEAHSEVNRVNTVVENLHLYITK